MKDIVVGMGEALWDVLPDGKKIGGAPANFAYHVSQFGLNSCVVSAVGGDTLGKEIIDNLTSKGVNHHIAEVPYPTGTVQVEIDQAGIPQYEIKENVAWDNIPYTASLKALAENTRAVCFGSLAQRNIVSRETIHSFLDAMPKNDENLVVFDVNLRQGFYSKEILCASMKRCNILKINDEELVAVSRMFGYPGIDLQDKCWILLGKYNLKMLILTCGINGSYVFTPGHVSYQPTPKVEVADTVGAGDSFTAAFIASILKGKEKPEAQIAIFERKAGWRITGTRGFDVISNSFFVNETLIHIGLDGKERKEDISLLFEDFDSYFYFLDGDIYNMACYTFCHLPENTISSKKINLERFFERKSFLKKTIDDFSLSTSDDEMFAYREAEQIHNQCKQWVIKFNDCTCFDEFVNIVDCYNGSNLATIIDNVEFFLFQYIIDRKNT